MMYLSLSKKLFISTALASMLMFTGCSSSDGDSSGGAGGDTPSASTASGLVVDGYIANGHLYADIDGSKSETAGDINTTTDAEGNFTFGEVQVPHGTYLYLTGGTDLATSTLFSGTLRASFQGNVTVVSPLSTIVVALMQNEGLSYNEAVARASLIMGLTQEQVIADPFAEPVDTDVFVASQRVMAAATLFGGDFSAAVDALAVSDMNITAAAALMNPVVAPADALAVDAFILDLQAQMPADATVEDLIAYQLLIVNAMNNPASIPDVADAVAVANALACVTFDAIKGSNLVESNITTDLVLGGCENPDDNVSFAWNSDNTGLLGSDGVVVRPDYSGGDVNLTITVTSDHNSSVSADKMFALTIPRLDNHLPVANPDTNTTAEETAISFNVLANDTDADNDTLILTAVSGGVAFSADGTITYTPVLDFNGDFIFNYTVQDSWGDEVNGTVTITVTPINDAPVLEAIADVNLAEDFISYAFEVNASDAENDTLAYDVVNIAPAIMGASFTGSQLTLTSITDLYGDANVTVVVSDGDKNDTTSFVVHVAPVDDAPVINAVLDVTFDEDGSGQTTVSATDAEGDTIVYSAADYNTTLVSVAVTGNVITFTGQPNAFGTTDVNITATANGLTDSQLITVTVNPVNDAPVITTVLNDLTVDEDFSPAITIALAADDAEGNSVTYSVVATGAAVDASIIGSGTYSLRLAAVADANGDANITVTANDGSATSDKSFVLHITPVNDAPVIAVLPDITKTEDDPAFTVELNATDVDDTTLIFTASPVSNSILTTSITGSTLTITPKLNANGVQTITVQVSDGNLTDTTTFDLNITAVNDAPVANDFTVFVTTGDQNVTIDVAAHIDDPDIGDTHIITSFDPLTGLTQTGNSTFEYDNDGSEGTFIVNYTVEDTGTLSDSGVMTIVVSTMPVYPVANPDSATTDEEVAVNIDVLANDINASTIANAWVATPANGTVQIEANNTITFTPALDVSGAVIVKYTAASTTGHEDNGTVNVTINDINDAPVVAFLSTVPVNLTESTTQQSAHVDLNISDVDTDLVSVHLVSVVPVGIEGLQVAAFTNDAVDMTVAAYANGDANVTLEVFDGQDTTLATFEVHVTPVDSAPFITTTETSVDLYGGAVEYNLSVEPADESFTLSLSDPGDSNIAIVTPSSNTLIIDPVGAGTTTVTVHAINDANGALTSDTNITIHVVDPSNLAPVAGDSVIDVVADSVAQTVLNVTDANGDPLTFTIVSGPSNGSVLSIDAYGNIAYAATGGYIGDDSFTFKANDGALESGVATVTVHVTASPYVDSGDLTEKPITLDEFNAYTGLTNYGVPMYSVWEEGWNTESMLSVERITINESPQELYIFHVDTNVTDVLPYVLDTDNATVIIDFDGDTVDDLKGKYIGTASKEELELELNLTLPATATGYKMATLNLHEDYELWSEPEYADCNATTCSNPYSTLADFMTDKTYVTGVPRWQSMWISGYNFKFAEGSNLGDGNGTIIRTASYWDGIDHEIVTNDNAGTWEFTQTPNGDDVIIVTPTVYGITLIRIFMINTNDNFVYPGAYHPANSAYLEYRFDESTMYHVGNSIMNATVTMSEQNLSEPQSEFISFNSLPTATMASYLDVDMYGIWAWSDFGTYIIDSDRLRFDNNGSVIIEEAGGTQSFDYNVTNDIATLSNGGLPFVEAKIVETIADAATISALTGVPLADLGSTPVAYRMAHLELYESLDIWDNDIWDLSFTTTYPDFGSFQTAFMSGQVALDYTPNGGIGYASGIAGVGGILAEYDISMNVVTPNAGTWEVKNVDGQDIIVFDVTVQRNSDYNAIAESSLTGNMGSARYNPADTGNVELRYDLATRDAIVTYLQDQNVSGNQINFQNEIRIGRDVEAIPFVNDQLYTAHIDVNPLTCDANVTRHYIWLNGDSGSGSFVISDDPTSYTYTSADGKIATISIAGGDPVMYGKLNREINGTELSAATGLFLPSTALGYEVSHMDIAGTAGAKEIRLDATTVEYLESYLNNNPIATGGCIPAP